MTSLYVASHGIEGLAFLLTSVFLYWRMRSGTGLQRVTKLTTYVMALLGMFMSGIYASYVLFTPPDILGGVSVIHIFVFGATAYMWKFITVFLYSSYEKYHRVFWALGGVSILIGVGIFSRLLPPLAGKIWPLTLVPAGIAIGVIGLKTARELGGADGQKMAIFTLAGLDALLISAILNNAYQAGAIGPLPAIVNNLVFGSLFVLAVYWGEIKDVNW
ncbi:MAG: hypothetical protein ABEK01_04760 [Candidatus Nanohaloarchaea archaeon]